MEKKIGYTQGTFDMFHIGHLNLIRNAKKHCDYLIVGVNADDLVESYKNKRPIVPLEERAEIVRAIRYVDEVIVTTTLDKKQVWEKVHFNEIYIGDDWKGNARWEKTGKEMEELGAKLVFLPYTKDTSSTMLREKLKEFQGARYEKKNKKENKKDLAAYLKETQAIEIDADTIFDIQVKRLHEYKRQQLNALNIIAQYNYLKANPNADFVPKTYIFAAKAAPGYYMAKQIIKLIWNISQELKKDKKLNEKLNVIFLEDYNVSLSEILMPAANISEQISLAGTEASGTGNMKLMINGAITLGTLDGANVEIHEQVGDDNIIIFGMNVDEVNACKSGYKPMDIYNSNAVVKQAIDTLQYGINGQQFNEIADSLKNSDPYMALKDFDSYQKAQAYASECYKDQTKWQKMSLANIAGAGIFSADRSVEDYARDIWGLSK